MGGGHHGHSHVDRDPDIPEPPPPMKVTHEQMKREGVPLAYRDNCAHLLIPLNRCRYDNYHLPWKCFEEKGEYLKCQHHEYERRVREAARIRRREFKKMQEAKEAKEATAASAPKAEQH
mmetsp:Transcript_7604/g.13422  ORF Transcript_7604/g.13422 Transcript_7604/m.13422 type:complete len:119 (+) Transcript_7604:156-512(+)